MKSLGEVLEIVKVEGFAVVKCENGFVRIDPVREGILRLRVAGSG